MKNVQTSLRSLQTATAALQRAQAAQMAATASARIVPDGLTIGGLQSTSTTGAIAPTQTTSGGRTQVTVKQTQPHAVLNWSSFNVGAKTTLSFDQSAGGANAPNWAALNLVTDPSSNPSQILGRIQAPGQVYILNPNGVVFGAGSQVNLHALVAASTQFGSNGSSPSPFVSQFKSVAASEGTPGASNTSPSIYGTAPTFTGATGAVTVEPGALITTDTPVNATRAGGFVLLFGSDVKNGGAIATPNGQTVLAGGSDFILQPGYSITQNADGSTSSSSNLTATVRGSVVAPVGAGSVINSGLITATTGDITLTGSSVTQAGVLMATTSVDQRGTVHLTTNLVAQAVPATATTTKTTAAATAKSDTAATTALYALDPGGQIVLSPDSATLIVNDTGGATALSSQRAASLAASVAANQQYAVILQTSTLPTQLYTRLPDTQNQSRIEITAGGTVDFRPNSLTLATGGQIATSAGPSQPAAPRTGRIVIEPGATLDVAGSLAAVLPVSANVLTVQVEGFQLRDNPLNRDPKALNNLNVRVDARDVVIVPASPTSTNTTGSVGYSSARAYIGGSLLEVSGGLGLVTHTIDEFTASGGTVTLSAPTVSARANSVINIAGGAITYEGGLVPQTYLTASNGQFFNVNVAPGTLSYTGVYEGQTFTDRRWNISQTYRNPLIAPSSLYEPGYVVGRDAGTLTVSAGTAVLSGTVNAGVVTGASQNVARASGVSDPFLQAQNAAPLGGTLAFGSWANFALNSTATGLEFLPSQTSVAIVGSTDPRISDIGMDAIPMSALSNTVIQADAVNGAQLGGLTIASLGPIGIDAPIALASGGALLLTAPQTLIRANVTVRGGSIAVTDSVVVSSADSTYRPLLLNSADPALAAQNEVLAAGATIDTRGLWTNALLDPYNLSGQAYLNGGSVSFTSARGIAILPGSLIDTSSGGVIGSTGKTTGGTGGAISILADTYSTLSPTTPVVAPGPVTLGDGTLRSIGAAGCATSAGCGFTLTAPLIRIGDALSSQSNASASPPTAPAADGVAATVPSVSDPVILPTSFFASGFSSYTLSATAVAPARDALGNLVTDDHGRVTPLQDRRGNALAGITVAPDTRLAVAVPSYQFSLASRDVPSGADPASAFTSGLLPLYLANPQTATLSQRPSASLSLSSDFQLPGLVQRQGGAITIGQGAAVSVDPGASVAIRAVGSILVAGSISAPNGTISLVSDTYQGQSQSKLSYVDGQTIRVASQGSLDVSARAFAAFDTGLRPFGIVPAGGSILIGGPDVLPGAKSTNQATDAFVVIEQGAVLDASGTSATIDPAAGLAAGIVATLGGQAGARLTPSAGGLISLNSASGIVLDGTLRAGSGGVGASGGTLSVAAETPNYSTGFTNVNGTQTLTYLLPNSLRGGRNLIVEPVYERQGVGFSASGVQTSGPTLEDLIGQTRIGADQVAAGGFGAVNLSTQDALVFNPNTRLFASRSITLTAGAFGQPAGQSGSQVKIDAPYVSLSGTGGQAVYTTQNPAAVAALLTPTGSQIPGRYASGSLLYIPSGLAPTGDLTIGASQIDVSGFPAFGQQGAVGLFYSNTTNAGMTTQSMLIQSGATPSGGLQTTELAGFARLSFSSSGDIRFLASPLGGTTTLLSAGNIALQAQQIYPASNAIAQVIAGAARTDIANGAGLLVPTLIEQPGGLISITSGGSAPPALPQSVGGSLIFVAQTIDQGGVVRAPLGSLQFGATTSQQLDRAAGTSVDGNYTSLAPAPSYSVAAPGGQITLRSLVDVTAATGTPLTGSVMLEPGSISSVSANGLQIAVGGTTDGTAYCATPACAASFTLGFKPQITLAGARIVEQPGAVLDLSGGGTLSGIGFVTGAGGSVDILVTPGLTLANGGKQPTNPVYSIVAGPQPVVAQASLEGYASPGIGQQVTVPAGIPDLPAGTYTLLPADNALRPGGYRVELSNSHALFAGPLSMPSGGYLVDVQTGVAATSIASVLPTVATVTPAAKVRGAAQYNEETYSQFVSAQAALRGQTRTGTGTGTGAGPGVVAAVGGYAAILPEDGGRLTLSLLEPLSRAAATSLTASSAVLVQGSNNFAAAPGGYGGEAIVVTGPPNALEITSSPNARPDLSRGGPLLGNGSVVPGAVAVGGTPLALALVDAQSLSGLGADVLSVGGTLDPAATLSAPEVVFTGTAVNGTISTIGRSGSLESSVGGITFLITSTVNGNPFGQLVLSNAILQPSPNVGAPTNALVIGRGASLAAGGSLVFATGNLTLPTDAAYGAANIQIATNNVLIGAPGASTNAPPGVTLTNEILATLVAGNPTTGAPPLRSLTLTASNAIDIFGSVNLTTASLQQVEFNTPSIQGAGSGTDAARITAGTFVWNGLVDPAAPVQSARVPDQTAIVADSGGNRVSIGPGSGTGTLQIAANTIILGYGDSEVPTNQNVSLDRALFGFSGVTLSASEAIVARGKGTLIAYQAGGLAPDVAQPVNGKAYAGTGGRLTLDTPLLTSGNAAVLKVSAGGAISLDNTAGVPASAGSVLARTGQGGEIDLIAASVSATGASIVALPAGKLTALASAGDVAIAGAIKIDLAGRSGLLFDQRLPSPGGSLVLESTAGSVRATGSIDVSAAGAKAGTIEATALGGTVTLDGALSGGGGGGLTLRANTLPQDVFDRLQASLNTGGFNGTRSIEVGSGDIAVTDRQLVAHTIKLAVDAGNLTVNGLVDAHGATPGSISLAAGGNLAIAAGALLDAHGSLLQVDSTGSAIDAENRATIQLRVANGTPGTPGAGRLSIGNGAVLDVSSPETVAQGTVTITVPRMLTASNGGALSETGDLPVQIGNAAVNGAGTIAVVGSRAYAPSAAATLTQADLDAWHVDSTSFIAGALPNGALTAGLASKLGTLATNATLHLRPGIEVVTPGDLTTTGDLDLSGYRYTSLDPAHRMSSTARGSGEPGVLTIRSGGTLTVSGSITDGFAPPTDGTGSTRNPDDNGWTLSTATSSLLGNVTLPNSVTATTLAGSPTGVSATTFPAAGAVNYNIVINQNMIKAGTTLPIDVVLGGGVNLPAGTLVTADVIDPVNGNISKGTTLSASRLVSVRSTLSAGFVTPVAISTLGQTTIISRNTKLSDEFVGTISLPNSASSYTVPAGVTFMYGTPNSTTVFTARAGNMLLATTQYRFLKDSVLPFDVLQPLNQGQTWPANASLGVFSQPVVLERVATVQAGSVIPAGSTLFLSDTSGNLLSSSSIALRPSVNGVQGAIYAAAAPLPAGSLSWSIDAVSGANIASADRLALQASSRVTQAGTGSNAGSGAGNLVLSDPHVGQPAGSASRQLSFSVVRTGTGDLNLAAGGNLVERSLFGVYTAGTVASGASALDALVSNGNAAASQAAASSTTATVAPIVAAGYGAAVPSAGAHAYSYLGGGDLTVAVQGTLSGYVRNTGGNSATAVNESNAVGRWLWRQSGTTIAPSGSWGVNTGTYVPTSTLSGASGPYALAGFTGFGTLGGGNVSLTSGGDAGIVTTPTTTASGGLVVAAASSSYIDASGNRVTNGGGDVTIRIGGTLNPVVLPLAAESALTGTIVDLRGKAALEAGAIGQLTALNFGLVSASKTSGLPGSSIYVPSATTLVSATPTGGPALVPGDSQFTVSTRGDLVLAGVGDATRVAQTAFTQGALGTTSWFTLWTDKTSVALASSGGNVSPVSSDITNGEYLNIAHNEDAISGNYPTGVFEVPSQLRIVANAGSILDLPFDKGQNTVPVIELAPSPTAQLDLLAGQSIYTANVYVSGADPGVVPTSDRPASYAVDSSGSVVSSNIALQQLSSLLPTAPLSSSFPLFAFGPDVAAPAQHANDNVPVRFYAGGDIVYSSPGRQIAQTGAYFQVGAAVAVPNPTLTVAAKPVWLRAGGDVVGLGQTLTPSSTSALTLNPSPAPVLILNTGAASLSLVQAGRDIVQTSVDVAGPGTLEVSAGRQLYQPTVTTGAGTNATVAASVIRSIVLPGALATGQGTSIDVLAGVGAAGPDVSGAGALYFDPANLANAAVPLQDQPGKVLATYQDQLLAFMRARGYVGTDDGALAAFQALDPAVQAPLLVTALFSELTASGTAASDPGSRFYKTYIRGNQAISALFPAGRAYQGDVTIFGSSGIRTLDGGGIDIVAPGGRTVLGIASQTSSASSGILTQGSGDVGIYSRDSVLLGQSRVFTTLGGGITIWSAQGDVNAGQGAKTTQVFTPPSIAYDTLGNITLSPTTPASGAGIATLSPVPGIPPGDVVLVAPLGAIDAGEAGIRSTGSVAIAARVVIGASNIQSGGKTTGAVAPSAPAAPVNPPATASNPATTGRTLTSSATDTERNSLITVDVQISDNPDDERKKRQNRP